MEVESTLSAGDYHLRITKNGRNIERLFIQNETLMAEYRLELFHLNRIFIPGLAKFVLKSLAHNGEKLTRQNSMI